MKPRRPASAAAHLAPVPPPRITARGVGIAALGWTAYSAAYAMSVAVTTRAGYLDALLGQLVHNLFLALCSMPVWLLVVRRMDGRGWGARLALHALIAPLYAWVGLQTLLLLLRATAGDAAMEGVKRQSTWVFLGVLVVYLLQFSVYHAVRAAQRGRAREREAAELHALAQRQELAVLRAQVNPHFLFNALNSISATVVRDPEGTREMIARLAELLRYALDAPEHDRVPLGDELRFARDFLELEQRRFPDRLRVRYAVDPGVLHTPAPVMVLQPLVENAVKHGIAPHEHGGEVLVRIARADGRVEVSVEDAPAGGAAPASARAGNGIGLANTDARLRGLFGPAAGLCVDPHDGGFRVRFSLPAVAP